MSDSQARPAMIDALSFLLAPLTVAAESEDYLRDMASAIGWNLDAVAGVDIALAVRNLKTLADDVQAFTVAAQKPPDDLEGALELLKHIGRVFDSLQNLNRILSTQGPSHFEEFGRDLLHAMVVSAFQRTAPISLCIAELLTLVDVPGTGPVAPAVFDGTRLVRRAWPLARVHLDRLKPLLRDPVAHLNETYFGADGLNTRESALKAADRLLPRLARLTQELGLSAFYGLVPGMPIAGDAQAQEDFAHVLTVFGIAAEDTESGATLAFSAAPGLRGLVARPFGSIRVDTEIGEWRVVFEATEMVGGLLVGENIEVQGDGALRMKLSAEQSPESDAASYLGGKSGSGIEFGKVRLEGELALGKNVRELALMSVVDNLRIRLSGSDGDGFLAKVLPANDLSADIDFAFGWSNQKGVHFRGSAGLETTRPLSARFGPVRLSALTLGIATEGDLIRTQVSLDIGLAIGPVGVQVDRVGVEALIGFPDHGGNLGVANLDLHFKPPNGLGLVIDATGVSGGGYLFFDPDKGQYAGVLQLNIQDKLTVTAIGLISTRLPDGAKGFSFVVIITALGFSPIQLGLGFALTGIGGLLAINRTCNEEFLSEGIKTNSLDSLLFPRDPIRNAPQIFGTLNNAFPPRIGSYLFGPVVRIAWGTPPVLTIDVALILELGSRTRLIILGVVKAIMPSEKHDLIRLQMNALGVIDFDQGSISLDAVLYDSRLAGKFPITGSMAMRLRWGSAPVFALSIGGFHPAFKPPANFPVLQRLAISFSNSESFRLRAECYFAITSNTLQFGAKMELYAKAAGFSIEGQIGFDVLIQFDPLFFIADFYASVQLKRGSHNLFKVKVEGKLTGPRPLHVKGKATFEIFWCDFSVRFDKTLVSGDPPPALAPIDVLAQLVAALGDARNWTGSLPAGDRRLVTLREEVSTDHVSYHPLEALSVKQKVVPLGLEIARFGSSTPSGARFFTIRNLSLSGKETKFDPLLDFFAPAQFLELSDDEKLLAPSFEQMKSGISLTREEYVFSSIEADILEDEAITYETIIIDQESEAAGEPTRKASGFSISPELLRRSLVFGAAALSPVSRTGSARYRPAAAKNAPAKKGWTVVSAEDGSPQGAPGLEAGKTVSYSESFQALQKLKQENPARAKTLMLVRISVN